MTSHSLLSQGVAVACPSCLCLSTKMPPRRQRVEDSDDEVVEEQAIEEPEEDDEEEDAEPSPKRVRLDEMCAPRAGTWR